MGVVLLTACSGGSGPAASGASVPEGWQAAGDGALQFAIPPEFVVSDPPVDPDATREWRLGDAEDVSAPSIATYRSDPTTDEGEPVSVAFYKSLVFGIQGGVGGPDDFATTETTDVDVPGAIEAGRFQATFTVEQLDEKVVQDVLVVVTEDAVHDLRLAQLGEDTADAAVDPLFASVTVE